MKLKLPACFPWHVKHDDVPRAFRAPTSDEERVERAFLAVLRANSATLRALRFAPCCSLDVEMSLEAAVAALRRAAPSLRELTLGALSASSPFALRDALCGRPASSDEEEEKGEEEGEEEAEEDDESDEDDEGDEGRRTESEELPLLRLRCSRLVVGMCYDPRQPQTWGREYTGADALV